ncbi:lipoyl(octanoyl) transferase LipB [Gordonia amicalis]|uniref:lipoyl(octanoyl) transferase LipB n=1 Tax=Gordonia amicalis TaxID=89053 RepID=UPI0002A655B8|nr:lipoyl(octanoyl) transferase LipB [Gordonia amicalis]MBA5849503.1 lipoyl(octanoyl) transferase LipB [Gordonia amicalis]MCZ0913751.1 lipoyl(octanoyl) transferase LipB [Gordonia amicalis]MDJ0452278.1 lipoyl(octanoyl) transferase LipB [Gordonia amicalis]MDV7074890.1 lipoyl(octanoyl) transferase LipB [Gordonia amicalis]MDV7172005.1 lipoyl(octanoyl) transferase LipB [Gordonia amicalis]
MTQHSVRADSAPIEVRRLGIVDYRAAYEMQHRLATERADGTLDHDVLLLLEHPSTYTAGKRTEDADRPTNGAPVIDVDRGGRITWHGPGQLVGYPIVKLAEPLDVVEYVRRLETALISVCADLGVTTGRVEGRSGVWIDDDAGERKLGQIGIRVARGVALHGFALNVDPDMSAFEAIVPCGIADAGVTSLARELAQPISVTSLLDATAAAVLAAMDTPREPAPTATEAATTASVGSVR